MRLPGKEANTNRCSIITDSSEFQRANLRLVAAIENNGADRSNSKRTDQGMPRRSGKLPVAGKSNGPVNLGKDLSSGRFGTFCQFPTDCRRNRGIQATRRAAGPFRKPSEPPRRKRKAGLKKAELASHPFRMNCNCSQSPRGARVGDSELISGILSE